MQGGEKSKRETKTEAQRFHSWNESTHSTQNADLGSPLSLHFKFWDRYGANKEAKDWSNDKGIRTKEVSLFLVPIASAVVLLFAGKNE